MKKCYNYEIQDLLNEINRLKKSEENMLNANIKLLDKNKELFEDIKVLIRYINKEYKTDEEYKNLLINVNEIINYYYNKTVIERNKKRTY